MTEFSAEMWQTIKDLTNLELFSFERNLSTIQDPHEILFARAFYAQYRYWFFSEGDLLEIFKECDEQFDDLSDILKLWHLNNKLMDTIGLNTPILPGDEVEVLWSQIDQLSSQIENKNTSEYKLVEGWNINIRALEVSQKDNDYKTALSLHIETKELYESIPEIGVHLTAAINLGVDYSYLGQFENAEQEYLKVWNQEKLWVSEGHEAILLSYSNLIYLYRTQGELEKIEELSNEGIEVGSIHSYKKLLRMAYDGKILLANLRNDFGTELDYLKKQLELATDPPSLMSSYLDMVYAYELQYRVTKDPSHLQEAWMWYDKREEVSEVINDRPWRIAVWKGMYARLLSHGTLRDKGKAMGLLEELLEESPTALNFRVLYLDLLFQELTISDSALTRTQIEDSMRHITEAPLQNSTSIMQTVAFRRLQAQYLFYVKDQYDEALQTLVDTEKLLEGKSLLSLRHSVQQDRQKFENEISKWKKTDSRTRDKIMHSKISDYLAEAIKMSALESE